MKSRKLLFYVLFSLTITGVLTYGFIQYEGLTSYEPKNKGNQFIEVVLRIDFAGVRPTVSQSIISNTSISVLSLLELGGHNVSVRWYGELAYVQAIDGVWENKDLDGYYWIYYVNGAWGDKASNLFYLESGMVVEWKYETPSYA